MLPGPEVSIWKACPSGTLACPAELWWSVLKAWLRPGESLFRKLKLFRKRGLAVLRPEPAPLAWVLRSAACQPERAEGPGSGHVTSH